MLVPRGMTVTRGAEILKSAEAMLKVKDDDGTLAALAK